MSKFNLKSVFSAPLIIFSPFRKLKLNGFLGGIIFGAIFSLAVNMVTVQVQEMIQKQRILESIELEIMNNYLQANNVAEQNTKKIVDKVKPNVFHVYSPYFNDIMTQSTEPLQYLAQIDPSVQAHVITYYSTIVLRLNEMMNKLNSISEKEMEKCFGFYQIGDKEENECSLAYYSFLDIEADTADSMAEHSLNVLDVFHPTSDRLNNPILRIFMGDKSVRFLSGK